MERGKAMNILVVDDQIHVIEGIYHGVDWKKLGIDHVYTALNAPDARNIIREQDIDLLLSDIEMPEESGLDLLRWVREQKNPLKCIFLTAHADFDYAKTAVSLGGFDYILQPARYSDIEKVLLKAICEIDREKEQQKYSAYGKMFLEERNKLVEHVVFYWFTSPEETISMDQNWEELRKMGIEIDREQRLLSICVQVFAWTKDPWEKDMVRYVLNNILEELLADFHKKTLVSYVPKGKYYILVYGGEKTDMEALDDKLQQFASVASQFLGWNAAMYIGESLFTDIPDTLMRLQQMDENNIAQQQGIFYLENQSERRTAKFAKEPDYRAWEHLLVQGYGKQVDEEAGVYLDMISSVYTDAAAVLLKFYEHFIKVVHLAEAKTGTSIEGEITEEHHDLWVRAYESVDSMKKLVRLVSISFSKEEKDAKGQIEKVKEYIYQNLDQDLRRDEIAMEIFVNPNYLSSKFKKEEGISLKSFIIQEKMKMAQRLLRSSELPVSIVALKVGYSNFSHFSQAYRKQFGISPTDERGKKL